MYCVKVRIEEIRVIVHGRVQMVMFRDFVEHKARSLGLTGYVLNQDDGSVEVVAQGSRESLEKLIEYLHKGSFLARVERVDTELRKPSRFYDSFDIVF